MANTPSSTENAQLCGLTPPWSTIEDDNLTRIVQVFLDKGINNNWSVIAENLHAKTSATVRSGRQCKERWLKLLDVHVQHNVDDGSSSNSSSGRRDPADRNNNRSRTLPSPRPNAKGSSGLRDRAPPCSSVVFRNEGGWGSFLGPSAKSNQNNESSLTSRGPKSTGRAKSPHAHGGPRSPASAPLTTGSVPSVFPATSSPPKGVPAPTVKKTGQQCKMSDERLLGKRPVPGTLPKMCGTPSNSPGVVVENAVDGPRRPLSSATNGQSSSGFYAEDHAAYSHRMPASRDTFVPMPASASHDMTVPPDIREASTASRPATVVHHACPPRMDSSMAVATTTAETTALYGSSIGSMIRPPPMTSMPQTAAYQYQYQQQQQQQQQQQYRHPYHQQHYQPSQQYHQQQQYQQRCMVGMGSPRVRTGCVGGYPMAIPGTSVRRYMHTQLLLSLMSAPGLSVVTTAKASWDRLGYYPVDAVFGPPAPGSSPSFPRDLRQSFSPSLPPGPTPLPHNGSLHSTEDIELPPPKRLRSFKEPESGSGSGKDYGNEGKGGGVPHAPDIEIPSNTGAMAMPPAQHSPRTSAMLSGLLRTENAIMLGDSEGIAYSASSPTGFIGLEGVEPLSPSYFPGELIIPEGHSRRDGAGGEGGSEDGGEGEGLGAGQQGDDDGQSFDFVAAFGGGSQAMIDSFPADFEPVYSPKPVSPGFGASRLSPLAGSLSPPSLSPRNWTSDV